MKQIIIDGIKTKYTIDEDGNVFGSRGKLSPIMWSNGRYMFSFNVFGKKIRKQSSRIVGEYCIEAPTENLENMTINHIDGDKMNDHPSNLEWISIKDNIIHAFSTGLCRGKCYRKVVAYVGGQSYGEYSSINQCAKATGGQCWKYQRVPR